MTGGIKCEHPNCAIMHSINYGSDRFCSKECARSFATIAKRDIINQKLSTRFTGRAMPWLHTQEANAKRSRTLTGHVVTGETRQQLRLKNIGKNGQLNQDRNSQCDNEDDHYQININKHYERVSLEELVKLKRTKHAK